LWDAPACLSVGHDESWKITQILTNAKLAQRMNHRPIKESVEKFNKMRGRLLTVWEEVVNFPIERRPSGTDAMLLLTGEYQHVIDDKGRVLVSNKLRNQIDADEHGSNFYLVLGANGVLCLYPEKYFEQLMLSVTPGATAPDEAVAFERISFALSSKVELDNQGRLLLNDKLRKRAGLKEDITLVGVRDHIELWNTADWEQYLSDHLTQYQKQMTQARQFVMQQQAKEL
jgi:MraZ protein